MIVVGLWLNQTTASEVSPAHWSLNVFVNFGCRRVIITQTHFTKRIAISSKHSADIFHFVILHYKDVNVTIDWCQKDSFVDLCIQTDHFHLKIYHYHSFVDFRFFFFYLSFLSRTPTIHRSTGEVGGYFFNSCLPLPPSSQKLRN